MSVLTAQTGIAWQSTDGNTADVIYDGKKVMRLKGGLVLISCPIRLSLRPIKLIADR